MTKQEIKELVSKKIAGQGSQVDIGGALAEILNGIVDNIPEGGNGIIDVPFGPNDSFSDWTLVNVPNSILNAIAIRLNNGEIMPSRLAAAVPPEVESAYDPESISAMFGTVSLSDTVESYELWLFKPTIHTDKSYVMKISL